MGRKIKFQPLEQWLTLHSPPQGWINLPPDLTLNILRRLGPVEILETAQNVCATWRTVCRNPAMWRVIDMRYFSYFYHRWRKFSNNHLCRIRLLRLYHLFRSTCRRAVDLSKGELIDINIEHFGDNDLLLYISDRSRHLKRLRIKNCDRVSGYGLTAAVKKLPELEELHMSLNVCAKHVQTIGNCCPKLKSFTNNVDAYWRRVDNRGALAIARHMPNLRQLGLYGNPLSDGGLKAILDGCPHLESIDLRGCFNVHLDKQLPFESIDDLRRLFDHPTTDYCDHLDDDEGGYWNDYSSRSLEYSYFDPNDDYRNIDDDDDDDDIDGDLGYNNFGDDDAVQIEVNCWDAMDLSKKGELRDRCNNVSIS